MRAPSFEPRRRKELQEALLDRARAWLADWHPRDEGDFAAALFKVAARIESEVTQRLDRAPEKSFRAFLDWLGVKGKPGLAARLPVVFTMTPGSDPVDAPARVQLQVNAADTPVNFETEKPLRILPGTLASIVAADPKSDAFFQPPSGIFKLEEPALLPSSWRLKSDAPAQTDKLQLDPPVGLAAGMTLSDPSGQQYRVTATQGAIVTIDPTVGTIEPKPGVEPAAGAALAAGTVMTRVDVFTPFSATERNRQEHSLYIGSAGALNIETQAWIAVEGGAAIPPDATWWYSGKASASSPVSWRPIGEIKIAGADLLLHKPAGAIETFKIDGYQSRWLKASRTAGQIEKSSDATALRLSVNCKLPDANTTAPAVKSLEGIANTTPLVLDAGFYPFGREPRQFDSFYVGSKEAFSKPSAKAVLDFSLGAHVPNARAAIGLSDTEYLTVGVSEDGRLQRTVHRVSAGQPIVSFALPTQPAGADHRPIALNHTARPGAAVLAGVPYASASVGSDVWVWKQTASGDEWISLGAPFVAPDASKPEVRATMLARLGSELRVYAISGGRLYGRPLESGAWAQEYARTGEEILTVAPVLLDTARAGEQDVADGIVVISDLKEMWLYDGTTWRAAAGGPAEFDPDFYPLVVRIPGSPDRHLCVTRNGALGVGGAPPDLRPHVFDLDTSGAGYTAPLEMIGHTADVRVIPGGLLVVFAAVDSNQPAGVYVWDPFANQSPVAEGSSARKLVEGPLYVGKSGGTSFFYFAGEDGEAFVLPVRLMQTVTAAPLTDAVTFTDASNDWTQKDRGFPIDLDPQAGTGTSVGFVQKVFRGSAADTWVLELTEPTAFPVTNASVQLHPGEHDDMRTGVRTGAKKLELAGDDTEAVATGLIYVTDGTDHFLFGITTVVAGNPRTVNLAGTVNLPGSNGDALQYKLVDPAGVAETGSVHPLIDIAGLDPDLRSTINGGALEFSTMTPSTQTVIDVLAADGKAVLATPWTTMPASATVGFVAKAGQLFGQWAVFEPPKPRNPTLSWEYFDGTAWRLIKGLTDSTDNFAKGGVVEFCVPADLQETDVVGRKNHWIRARLVGGDYGQETVTVTTAPGSAPNTTTQTVDRNIDSIRAPYVASLTVTYRVCCAITPDVVLTRDNGGLRDQTDVNRNPGAIVEYFVPLSAALASAAGPDAPAGAADRALFLGFDTKLTGGPIQILFLAVEGTHDDAFPLRVDALTGGRFKPIVVSDETRGLNENGVVTMHLAESPQLSELFGTSKYWLRVRPSRRLVAAEDWQPRIRAAYLNATWAVAADTQEMEPLGSSDGSPNQRFRLARPPVIEDSLHLRILERLGDEDVEALKHAGTDVQKTLPNVPERTGCWVLWKQVVDPADEAPGARVYALDDATGIITFGNGLHGMIPPIGTNVILAERYQRGGGEAANAIGAWAQINLVTPLSGVNAVVNPDAAAGGSDPQDAETTVRFAPANLRLRDRALTFADFEQLALQFSRDIAQARAIPTRAGMRLVLVMRGRDSAPRAGVIRELRTHLLNHASPMLAGDEVLQIAGPEEIVVRVDLELIVDAIESSGSVAAEARVRLAKLLDPATGGHDRVGWALGEALTETEMAAELVGISHLEGIKSVVVTRRDGSPLTTLKPSQLIRLAPDGVAIAIGVPEEATA